MKRNIAIYLRDISQNIDHAESFVVGMDVETFLQDIKTVYAAIRCLEVMGEASKKIPAAFKNKYPAIPWKEIAGMRDKLIHAYSGVDPYKVG